MSSPVASRSNYQVYLSYIFFLILSYVLCIPQYLLSNLLSNCSVTETLLGRDYSGRISWSLLFTMWHALCRLWGSFISLTTSCPDLGTILRGECMLPQLFAILSTWHKCCFSHHVNSEAFQHLSTRVVMSLGVERGGALIGFQIFIFY